MSGGSYNYLCGSAWSDDRLNLTDLAEMRDRLADLAPGSAAAQDTAALHAKLSAAQDNELDALAQVWHDVEWFDSGDYSEAQAREGIATYEAAQRAAVPESATPGDLAARVLAAIDETERIALHAHGETWSTGSAFAVTATDGEEVISEGDSGCGGGVIDIPTTAHIVHNDPAAVRRRCAADRRVLDRHRELRLGGGPFPLGPSVCTHCDRDGARVLWPCPDFDDLADRYRITTEETT